MEITATDEASEPDGTDGTAEEATESEGVAPAKPDLWAYLSPDRWPAPGWLRWLVAIPVAANLWLLRQQALPRVPFNDLVAHQAFVRWAMDRIRDGHLPLDGWFPYLSGGSPVFHQYQSTPHVITAAIGVVVGSDRTVFVLMWLLMALWPICVYYSATKLFDNRWVGLAASVLCWLAASPEGYGYEYTAYTYTGLWAQLWAMWLFPLALALVWDSLRHGRRYLRAVLAVAGCLAVHVLTGYLLVLCLGVLVVVEPRAWRRRVPRAAGIMASALVLAAYSFVPAVTDRSFLWARGIETGTYVKEGFGLGQTLRWIVGGQLLDALRSPVLTVLAGVGLITCLVRARRSPIHRFAALMALLTTILVSGPVTFGRLLSWLPASDQLLFSRFVMGFQLAGVLLGSVGLLSAVGFLLSVLQYAPSIRPPVRVALCGVIALGVLVVPWSSRARIVVRDGSYARQQSMLAAAGLVSQLGRTGGLDRSTRCHGGTIPLPGRTPAAALDQQERSLAGAKFVITALPVEGIDSIGFHTRTLALVSDSEVRFDPTNGDQRDLWNVGCVIQVVGTEPLPGATKAAQADELVLYTFPTTGYLEVIDTIGPPVDADRRSLDAATKDFLVSKDLTERRFPLIRFPGVEAGEPTADTGTEGSGGEIVQQSATLNEGRFRATVEANRRVAVLLKAGFHPRVEVEVDGRRAPLQMVSPGFMAVEVPPGRHSVSFTYRSISWYWLFLVTSTVTVLLVLIVSRRAERRSPPPAAPEPPVDQAVDPGAALTEVGAAPG